MTTRLPDFPEAPGLAEALADRVFIEGTDVGWGRRLSPYVDVAAASTTRQNANRSRLVSSASQRVARARERLTAYAAITAGDYTGSGVYQSSMTQEMADRVLRKLAATRLLDGLASDYALAAVRVASSSAVAAWREVYDRLLAGEQFIVDNGETQIDNLDPGPVEPAP